MRNDRLHPAFVAGVGVREGVMGEWLCRLGYHKWRRRMAEQDPQFIEDGLALGLPVGVVWVDFCARGCGAGGRVEP